MTFQMVLLRFFLFEFVFLQIINSYQTKRETTNANEPFAVFIGLPNPSIGFVNATKTLYCKVEGTVKEPYKLIWKREDNTPFDENVFTTPDGQITFRPVKKEHEGSYVCTGTLLNTRKTSSAKTQFNIIPYEGWVPWIHIHPEKLTVQVGDPIEIKCAAIGRHPIQVQWNFKLLNSTLPDTATDNNGVLSIPRARLTDAGNYLCLASNVHGWAVRVVVITVDSKSK